MYWVERRSAAASSAGSFLGYAAPVHCFDCVQDVVSLLSLAPTQINCVSQSLARLLPDRDSR